MNILSWHAVISLDLALLAMFAVKSPPRHVDHTAVVNSEQQYPGLQRKSEPCIPADRCFVFCGTQAKYRESRVHCVGFGDTYHERTLPSHLVAGVCEVLRKEDQRFGMPVAR